jgi:hypothetical protein
LAQLASFIAEQTGKHDKIAEELQSSFGPTLQQIKTDTLTYNTVS